MQPIRRESKRRRSRCSIQEPCIPGTLPPCTFLYKSINLDDASHLIPPQYYNRWANHEQSAKLSAELYAKTEKKMEEMQITSELTWIEVQFMKKAVDEVIRCRTTLKWTYAMAYYLDSGNQKLLFEDNQR